MASMSEIFGARPQFQRGLATSGVPAGVNPDGTAQLVTGGKHMAADNMANVTRAQFYDYEQRFQPVERQLVALASDPAFIKQGEDAAGRGVDAAFNRQLADGVRSRARYGLSLKGDEAGAMLRQHMLARTGTKTAAVNAARLHGLDRQTAIMSGGLGAPLKKQTGV